jgi:hypothetical protein
VAKVLPHVPLVSAGEWIVVVRGLQKDGADKALLSLYQEVIAYLEPYFAWQEQTRMSSFFSGSFTFKLKEESQLWRPGTSESSRRANENKGKNKYRRKMKLEKLAT